MAGGKETPRQRMIGMMYLVLTALLALNISKEVLNGFVKVEKSLRTTQGTLNGKVKETMGELEAKYAANKEKVQPFMTQAQELNKRAEELVTYITQLKARAMSASVGDYQEQEGAGFSKYLGKDEFGNDTTLSLVYIDKKDEYQSLTAFMVGSEPQSPKQDEWSAHMLRVKMEEFRDYIRPSSSRTTSAARVSFLTSSRTKWMRHSTSEPKWKMARKCFGKQRISTMCHWPLSCR
jgi:predicted ribosome quality control (RQC) complex YloA/Tae2 family protein